MKEAVVDIETSDLSGKKIYLVGVYLLDTLEYKMYQLHNFKGRSWLEGSKIFIEIQGIFDDYNCIFHNAGFDVKILENWGFQIPNFEDTMLLSYVDYPSRPVCEAAKKYNSLEDTEKKVKSGHSLANWGFILGDHKMKQPSFDEWTPELIPYCKQDLKVTAKVWTHLVNKLMEEDGKAFNLYKQIEIPFSKIIMQMERNGMYLDTSALKEFTDEMDAEVARIDREIEKLVSDVPKSKLKQYKRPLKESEHKFKGQPIFLAKNGDRYVEVAPEHRIEGEYWYHKLEKFNPNSNYDIAWALVDLYQWVPTHFTGTKKPRTDTDVLEQMAFPLAKLLLERSKPQKMASTYGHNLLKITDDADFIHGKLNQTITKTGRLSSSEPNLQNFPKHGELGASVRKSFIAPIGYYVFAVDCSGFQMRICAWYLDALFGGKYPDASLMKDDFNYGYGDPHRVAAAKIFDKELDEVTDDERFIAKKGNFGDLFGIGVAKLAAQAKVSRSAASNFLQQKREKFPSVTAAKQAIIDSARRNGGVFHTLYGRRLHYADLFSKDNNLRSKAERQIFNAVIQGTEADIMKMLCLDLAPICLEHSAKLSTIVHDELFGYVAEDQAESFLEKALKVFDASYLPGLKMTGDGKFGISWYDCH